MWKTVTKKVFKARRNGYEDELLVRLREAVPVGVRATAQADRGFGDQKLYRLLRDLDFCVSDLAAAETEFARVAGLGTIGSSERSPPANTCCARSRSPCHRRRPVGWQRPPTAPGSCSPKRG